MHKIRFRDRQRIYILIRYTEFKQGSKLTWLFGQTWHDLQNSMRGGPWHVFQLIGHGGFNPNTDEGIIALANNDGKAEVDGYCCSLHQFVPLTRLQDFGLRERIPSPPKVVIF